jgi:hypothetical protein
LPLSIYPERSIGVIIGVYSKIPWGYFLDFFFILSSFYLALEWVPICPQDWYANNTISRRKSNRVFGTIILLLPSPSCWILHVFVGPGAFELEGEKVDCKELRGGGEGSLSSLHIYYWFCFAGGPACTR